MPIISQLQGHAPPPQPSASSRVRFPTSADCPLPTHCRHSRPHYGGWRCQKNTSSTARRSLRSKPFTNKSATRLSPGADWGRNLDAFNDILRGGFGTPEDGFVLRWTHSRTSRESLGYAETIRHLQKRLKRCHLANRESVQAALTQAQHGAGATVFDWLVDIIRDHGVGGEQSDDNVQLVLE